MHNSRIRNSWSHGFVEDPQCWLFLLVALLVKIKEVLLQDLKEGGQAESLRNVPRSCMWQRPFVHRQKQLRKFSSCDAFSVSFSMPSTSMLSCVTFIVSSGVAKKKNVWSKNSWFLCHWKMEIYTLSISAPQILTNTLTTSKLISGDRKQFQGFL